MLETRANTIYVSAISIAEIIIKISLKKLNIPPITSRMIEEIGFEELDFTAKSADLLKDLPWHHRDPFDRMLICQALSYGYPIMTDDLKFTAYGCTIA